MFTTLLALTFLVLSLGCSWVDVGKLQSLFLALGGQQKSECLFMREERHRLYPQLIWQQTWHLFLQIFNILP